MLGCGRARLNRRQTGMPICAFSQNDSWSRVTIEVMIKQTGDPERKKYRHFEKGLANCVNTAENLSNSLKRVCWIWESEDPWWPRTRMQPLRELLLMRSIGRDCAYCCPICDLSLWKDMCLHCYMCKGQGRFTRLGYKLWLSQGFSIIFCAGCYGTL